MQKSSCLQCMYENCFMAECTIWKLTAALRPGKLKKASGPCLWGIWLSTDNILTACFGCTGGKDKKGIDKTARLSLWLAGQQTFNSFSVTSSNHSTVSQLQNKPQTDQCWWVSWGDSSDSVKQSHTYSSSWYYSPRGLLLLATCWRAFLVPSLWCCSWPVLPTYPLANL